MSPSSTGLSGRDADVEEAWARFVERYRRRRAPEALRRRVLAAVRAAATAGNGTEPAAAGEADDQRPSGRSTFARAPRACK